MLNEWSGNRGGGGWCSRAVRPLTRCLQRKARFWHSRNEGPRVFVVQNTTVDEHIIATAGLSITRVERDENEGANTDEQCREWKDVSQKAWKTHGKTTQIPSCTPREQAKSVRTLVGLWVSSITMSMVLCGIKPHSSMGLPSLAWKSTHVSPPF